MADEVLKRDQNRKVVIAGIDNTSEEIIQARMEETTKTIVSSC